MYLSIIKYNFKCFYIVNIPCNSAVLLQIDFNKIESWINAVQVRVSSTVIYWTGPSRKLIGSDKWQYLNLILMSDLNETKN